jgi:hypothetical protein
MVKLKYKERDSHLLLIIKYHPLEHFSKGVEAEKIHLEQKTVSKVIKIKIIRSQLLPKNLK